MGVPAAEAHFDEADAVFDEAACQQATLAEAVLAIGLADLIGFLGQVEGAEILAAHQAHGIVIHVGISFHAAGVVFVLELRVQALRELTAEGEAFLGHALLRAHVLQAGLGIVHHQGAVSLGEETRAGMAAVIAHVHIGRQGGIARALEQAEPGTHARMGDGAAQAEAGVHEVVGLLMGGGVRRH